jgi:DTW domain-containing protein YfiP
VCYRPQSICFCHAIPSIANRTNILILQHVKERFHAFNTARIVRHALQNSTLIVDQTKALASASLPFLESTGVLYPGEDAKVLSTVPPDERPQQLVILDGTWHHAKTFMRQIPALQDLPRYCLNPTSPSNYRIRKEPTETALSTLEATVEALRTLESATAGLDALVAATFVAGFVSQFTGWLKGLGATNILSAPFSQNVNSANRFCSTCSFLKLCLNQPLVRKSL